MNVATDQDTYGGGFSIASIFLAYKWSIVFVTIVVVGAGLFLSSRQQPIYESQARVLVLPIIPAGAPEAQLANINLATERELALSESVGRRAADSLGTDESVRDLISGLKVDSPVETEIILFDYRHNDPQVARDRAQAFAEGYLDYRRSTAKAEITSSAEKIQAELGVLNTRLAEINSQIQQADSAGKAALQGSANFVLELILERQLAQLGTSDEGNVGQLFQDASVATSPVSPDPVRNGGLSFVIGLALGVSQALARNNLKTAKPVVKPAKEEIKPEPARIPAPYTGRSPTVRKVPTSDGVPPAQSESATAPRHAVPPVREPISRDRDRSPQTVETSNPPADESQTLHRYPIPRERAQPSLNTEGHVRKMKSPPIRTTEDHREANSPDDRKIREELFWASPAEQDAANEDAEKNPAAPGD